MPTPRAAQPTRKIFDAWNSSSTGHQRAENRLSGSTSWRDSRTSKLHAQLSDAAQSGQGGGGARLYDTVGAGSEFFGRDGRLENGGWQKGASGLRGKGQAAIGDYLRVGKGIVKEEKDAENGDMERGVKRRRTEDGDADAADDELEKAGPRCRPKQIFANLTFYINGSTYPTISDHKLKHLLGQHGGSLALGLARRRVTHVILGRSSTSSSSVSTGGGLSARKLQKEISSGLSGRGGVNAGIRYVSAEWVLECVRVGKRVAEWSTDAVPPTAVSSGPRQTSVLGVFERQTKQPVARESPKDESCHVSAQTIVRL